MNNKFSLGEFAVLMVIAVSAGFGFAVGMSLYEMVCGLIWSLA